MSASPAAASTAAAKGTNLNGWTLLLSRDNHVEHVFAR